jgi:hypothetical protein
VLLAVGISILVNALIGDSSGHDKLVRILTLVLPVLLGAGAWIRLDSSNDTLQIAWNARILLKGIAAAMAGFVIVALVGFPYRMTTQLANDIKAGRPVQISILPGLVGFEFVQMHVIFVANSTSLPPAIKGDVPGMCLMHLGGSDGDSYYYDFHSGHVLTLNDQDIVSLQPCKG